MQSWKTSNRFEAVTDYRVGDRLVFTTWSDETVLKRELRWVLELSPGGSLFYRSVEDGSRSPHLTSFENFTHSPNWWREVLEVPYDPDQQVGDEDDL